MKISTANVNNTDSFQEVCYKEKAKRQQSSGKKKEKSKPDFIQIVFVNTSIYTDLQNFSSFDKKKTSETVKTA